MAQDQPPRGPAPTPQDNAIAVISAYGAFRLLMVLLAIWTFFAGFSLFTQGVGALCPSAAAPPPSASSARS